jgi:hypothetical protein
MSNTPMTYFKDLTDVALAQDVIAKQPDLYIAKYELVSSGVYSEVTTVGKLTPATSPVLTVDSLKSTVFANLFLVDDDGEVCRVKVLSNTATDLSFTHADCLKEKDGTTAANLTVAATYQFYVLSPSAENAEGRFFGYTEGAELTISEEYMKFKYGIPKQTKFQDLLERAIQINGGTVNFSNEDVLSTVMNSDAYGLQTGKFSQGIGSDPDTSKYYRLAFVGNDRNGRELKIIARRVQISLNGNLFNKGESGHYMIPFSAEVLSESFYPDSADMMQIERAD